MIAVVCHVCDEELDEPGGLLFSQPDRTGRVRKKHLCVICLRELERLMARVRAVHRETAKA